MLSLKRVSISVLLDHDVVFKALFNPVSDKQHFNEPQNITSFCHFSSLSIYCFGCRTINRRAARRLIVVHPKKYIKSELNARELKIVIKW